MNHSKRAPLSSSATAEEEPPPIADQRLSYSSSTLNNIQSSSTIPEWKIILKESISTARQIARRFNLAEKDLTKICAKYPARITPYYLALIQNQDDAIYKQCIPSSEEIEDTFGEEDPLHEEPENQSRPNVPALLTHRYPDRLLFRISNQCAMFCRFCTRKRKVGDPLKNPSWPEIYYALEYIKAEPAIRDVTLSGGDPLMLDDFKLEKIIRAVYDIIHERKNGIIRIGTRIPCVLPQRITPELCQMLKKYQPLYLNTHFNHPRELTDQAKRACDSLADVGIPLACQTVLLKGVNDDPVVMKELMLGLLSLRVRPYYVYQADPVKGTNHFRTKVKKGLEIYQALRGHMSGLGVPTYVIDAPGGGGKIPVLPEYVIKITDDKVILKNYENKFFEYPQTKIN